MFRFSIPEGTPIDASPSQLAAQNITRDQDFAGRLQDAGEFESGEVYYRAENASPGSVREAVSFVRGLLFTSPARVWLDGELHEVGPDDLAGADKPVA